MLSSHFERHRVAQESSARELRLRKVVVRESMRMDWAQVRGFNSRLQTWRFKLAN